MNIASGSVHRTKAKLQTMEDDARMLRHELSAARAEVALEGDDVAGELFDVEAGARSTPELGSLGASSG